MLEGQPYSPAGGTRRYWDKTHVGLTAVGAAAVQPVQVRLHRARITGTRHSSRPRMPAQIGAESQGRERVDESWFNVDVGARGARVPSIHVVPSMYGLARRWAGAVTTAFMVYDWFHPSWRTE